MTTPASTREQIDAAVDASTDAFASWRTSTAAVRTRLLRGLANRLEAERDALAATADRETSLGLLRLNGEVARTAFQLRAFADAVARGDPFATTEDAAVPGAPPVGRPHLLRVRVPLGPVAMFAASNFPFAFSVLGGDTASALAAGCSVVVKAHPGHPELSRQVHALALSVLKQNGLEAGLLPLVEGSAPDVGVHLMRHPRIAAAAFTGSVRGGLALQREAQQRARPIPFFGELGSINPVVVLPAVLATQPPDQLARTLVSSIGLGCGQFCTSPGLIVVPRSAVGEAFVAALGREIDGLALHPMLHAGIRALYDAAVAARADDARLEVIAGGIVNPEDPPRGFLARIDAAAFLDAPELREEVFGPASLVVIVDGVDETERVLRSIGGALTVTLWGAAQADAGTRALVRTAVETAGRVLFQGVPTGVAVTAAQHHGGPYPATTDAAATSVGLAAMNRFLRPVALQDPPQWLIEQGGGPV